MSERDGELVAELNHKINSPLAAIRYAMYLAGRRSTDPVLLRYLRVAEDEVQSIADILRQARHLVEQMGPSALLGADPAEGGQASFSTSRPVLSNKKSAKDRKAAA
jgi:signal transduction histidine kinase